MKHWWASMNLWEVTHKIWGISIQKKWMKKYFKLARFSNFLKYFCMKMSMDYDYNIKQLKTHRYMIVCYPCENIKN